MLFLVITFTVDRVIQWGNFADINEQIENINSNNNLHIPWKR